MPRLTTAVLRALAPGESAYDSVMPGLVARKRKGGRVEFFVRRKGRHAIHRAIGNEALLSLTDAREAARKILAQHTIDRTTERGERYTLATAWPLYKAHLVAKKRSADTIYAYQTGLNRLTPAFRRATLRMLSDRPELFSAEHDRIAATHPPAAAATGRAVRAIYAYIRRRHDRTLPEQGPTIDRDTTSQKATNPRVLREEDMRAWWQRVQTMPDPIRREAHLFCLLSAMRPRALLAMKWDHQNRDDPTLFEIPRPKGGHDRAFTLVLSGAMQACLKRCLAHAGAKGRANGFVFPAWRGRGAVSALAKDRQITWYEPRALRRGFATVAETLGVPERTIGRFLNHASAERITSLYIRTDPGGAMLRKWQEQISAAIVKAVGDPALVEEPEEADAATLAAWADDSHTWPR